MKFIKDVSSISKEDLENINDCLVKFDYFLQQATRPATDENIAIYEHWIDCMYDIQKVIVEEEEIVEER